MSNDIVTRLRVLLGKCNIAPAMGVWSRDLRDAADEIERLRDERAARIDELVRNTDEFRETLTVLRRDVETLTRERDEARIRVCQLTAATRMLAKDNYTITGREVATEFGWGCYADRSE